MDDYADSLAKLPEFNEAQKLSVEDYYKYARGVFEYRSNCFSPLVWIEDKFYKWCKAMNCLKTMNDCKIPMHPLEIKLRAQAALSTLPPTTPMTTTYLQMVKSLGHNNTCYDALYCDSQNSAAYLHLLLGIFGLILCLIGVVFIICIIPALNVAVNRTGATLYLTVISVCDILYLSLFTVIVVIRYIPTSHQDQLEMYARFTSHLIPYGLPTMQMMELIAVWLTVALLVERFLYLKLGFHSKLISSRRMSTKAIVAIVFLVIVYTIPKYLEYTIISYPRVGMMKVSYTRVGYTESFQNLLLHWLKVPIEMFLPYLAVAIFSVLNSIKFYDLMYKRRLTEANQQNALNQHNINNNTINNNTNNNNNNTSNHNNNNTLDIEAKTALKFPSLQIARDLPILSNELKSLEDRENLNVIVALIIGFSMLALKVPKFVLHALKSESYVDDESTKYFQPATDFLDLLWVVFRPLLYLGVAKHLRHATIHIYCGWRGHCQPQWLRGGSPINSSSNSSSCTGVAKHQMAPIKGKSTTSDALLPQSSGKDACEDANNMDSMANQYIQQQQQQTQQLIESKE